MIRHVSKWLLDNVENNVKHVKARILLYTYPNNKLTISDLLVDTCERLGIPCLASHLGTPEVAVIYNIGTVPRIVLLTSFVECENTVKLFSKFSEYSIHVLHLVYILFYSLYSARLGMRNILTLVDAHDVSIPVKYLAKRFKTFSLDGMYGILFPTLPKSELVELACSTLREVYLII